jgi:hypothetical protein
VAGTFYKYMEIKIAFTAAANAVTTPMPHLFYSLTGISIVNGECTSISQSP